MADFSITISIPDATAPEVLATISAWRVRQKKEDGTPKYASNNLLGQSILIDALQRILHNQSEFDPASSPSWYKTHLDARSTANAAIAAVVNTAVTTK